MSQVLHELTLWWDLVGWQHFTCNALERKASYPFQQEQQPPHSEWSRCYRRSSDTGPRGPPKSQSGPERERWNIQIGKQLAEVEKRTIRVICSEQDERTYRCLSSDVGAAHYLRPSQRLLPLGSLPQGDQGGHVCRGTDWAKVSVSWKDIKVRLCFGGEKNGGALWEQKSAPSTWWICSKWL